MSINQVNSGTLVNVATADGIIGLTLTSVSQTFCINLVSLLGSLCQSNYLPLFAMTSSPLRLELTLQDQVNKIYGMAFGGTHGTNAIGGTINLSSVEYIANFMNFLIMLWVW